MKVSDILRVKGNTLYTVPPSEPLKQALVTMAEQDIGSLVVMNHGELAGVLTFREVIQAIVRNGGQVSDETVGRVMDDAPLTCTPAESRSSTGTGKRHETRSSYLAAGGVGPPKTR